MEGSVNISPITESRIRLVRRSAQMSREATRDLLATLYAAGLRFPDSLDIILRDLETALDRLQMILHPERLTDANNPSGLGKASGSEAEAPRSAGSGA